MLRSFSRRDKCISGNRVRCYRGGPEARSPIRETYSQKSIGFGLIPALPPRMRLARDSGSGALADYERALPETKTGVCVSTVSIVCSRDELPDRARNQIDGCRPQTAPAAPGNGGSPNRVWTSAGTAMKIVALFCGHKYLLMSMRPPVHGAAQVNSEPRMRCSGIAGGASRYRVSVGASRDGVAIGS